VQVSLEKGKLVAHTHAIAALRDQEINPEMEEER